MKPRVSFLRRLFRKILPRGVSDKPVRPAKPKRQRISGIEPLEGRIAPATLVSGNVISYNDLDGDVVTVTFSKTLFDPAKSIAENKLNEVFKFSNGTAPVNFESTGAQQLQLIDLTKVQTVTVNGAQVNPAGGTSVKVNTTAGTGAVGDDATNVGAIKATGLTLDTVKIEGDLGQIDVGTAASKVALRSLTVETLSKFGATTQLSSTSASDALESRITGKVRAVMVTGDLAGYLHAIDGTSIVNSQPTTTAPGKIGTITVAGSLRGTSSVAASSNNMGAVESAGTIGKVSVLALGNDVGFIGGGGVHSGSVLAKNIGTVLVKGGLLGGGGAGSGSIVATGDVGSVAVGSLVTISLPPPEPPTTQPVGGLKGGLGENSGSIQVGDALGSAALIGGIRGGGGSGSGMLSTGGAMGAVTLHGDITGNGANSGGISAGGELGSVIVTGNLVGGAASHSGFVDGLQNVGRVRVSGDVTGDAGVNSGSILASGNLASVTVGGKLKGGDGANSGSIFAAANPVTPGALASAKVKGGVTGGAGVNAGSIISEGAIGAARIGTAASPANLAGGSGSFSGAIFASGPIGSVTVSGAVVGGSGNDSGSIQASGAVAAVTIMGALTGAAGDSSGEISVGGRLAALIVGGGMSNAAIRIGEDLGAATITGGMSGSTISARGQASPGQFDLAIGAININGNVATSRILAGYDPSGAPVNADASIGFVKVNGNWTASDLVAGVQDTARNGFGNADDTKITGGTDTSARISQIGSVVIGGTVSGTAAAGDHYGFVAQQILSFKHGGTSLPLTASISLQTFELGTNGDVTVREVA